MQSDEHYFTSGIFSSKVITIEGQSWLQGEAKTVAKRTLGLKILCTKHNNELSSVDRSAIDFSRTIDKISQSVRRRSLAIAASRSPTVHCIDGIGLERWLVKYALGVIFEEKDSSVWHPQGSPPSDPPSHALDAVFGLNHLKSPMGLYWILDVGDKIRNEERVRGSTVKHPETGFIAGAMIGIRNYDFLIWLCDDDPRTMEFYSLSGKLFKPETNEPMYHLTAIEFKNKNILEATLKINWS